MLFGKGEAVCGKTCVGGMACTLSRMAGWKRVPDTCLTRLLSDAKQPAPTAS